MATFVSSPTLRGAYSNRPALPSVYTLIANTQTSSRYSYNFKQAKFTRNCNEFLVITNLTHFFHVFIYFMSLHVSSVTALIIRRSNCINTSPGMISLCEWLLGMPVRRELQFPPDRHTKQSLTQTNHTRWCINTIRSPDDERCDSRNM